MKMCIDVFLHINNHVIIKDVISKNVRNRIFNL